MNAARFRSIARRHVAWLLCVGMMLPFAQAMAGMHGISHIQQEASRAGKAELAQQAQCDLCLLAAGIGGSAPLPEPVAPAPLAVAHAQPEIAVDEGRPASPPGAYRSRAPPSTSL